MTNSGILSIIPQMWPIKETAYNTKNYPKLLAQISDPPKVLYCRGNIKLVNSFCFAVVGTRKLTSYGKEATERIITEISHTGWTIVSGLALGIDSIAHQSALDNDLPTIAVLGSTIDDSGIAPRTNFHLAKEILENDGLLISEYSTKDEIHKSNFAIRDRIISGLSRGVLVVEAAEKSGALITARCALEQNRDVFAVPGSVFSFTSVGPNRLIQKGAKLVTLAQDIIEEYSQNLELPLNSRGHISTKDPIEKKILAILDERGELTADEIISHTNLETSQIIAALSIMELNGKIKNKANRYERNK